MSDLLLTIVMYLLALTTLFSSMFVGYYHAKTDLGNVIRVFAIGGLSTAGCVLLIFILGGE